MGTFSAKVRIWNPERPEAVEELDLFVDTGVGIRFGEFIIDAGLKPG